VPASAPVATVGRYVLTSKVGEGGMGVVYLAQDPAGRPVAVKLLRPHVVSDDSGRARMAREVTSLRRVRSPLVAEVYDADPWGETPYLVTRYVAGPSLQDRVEHGASLAGPELESVAAGLAAALVAVHRVGVLHRDVKPSNVLLERSTPVLIDFGLAQLADDTRMTDTGWLLGTPGYLPRRSSTATTPRRWPTCTPGRRPWSTRRRGAARTGAGLRWPSWTASVVASTTSTACPTRCTGWCGSR
jgi:serine/threonine protein kinase